ncbi:MAG: hypothetical protein JRJ19_13740 [Deltaproteobacteria bacterium]|nr:hypothetical protein [Deltaproteobacteria bacterium]MBW1873126.1 hypothetical protein [Deltaproteobacteria bacterium]
MRTALTLATVVLFLVTPVSGSQERTHFPYSISMSADTGKLFGEVSVQIESERDKSKPKIKSIRLQIKGKWKTVPAKAFADLESPLLHKSEIRTERGWGDSPWLYIYFEVLHWDDKGKWHTRKVHIAWHKGRFEHRSITYQKPDGSTKWEKLDLP